MTVSLLLLIHFSSSLVMMGIIWFVQIVHYPLMANVGPNEFRNYSVRHVLLTQRVVSGPMLCEAVSAGSIFLFVPTLLLSPCFGIAIFLLFVIWISTAVWQIPLHQALSQGFDEKRIAQLVRSNWLRTIAWTLRAVLLGIVCFSEMRSTV